MVRPDWSTATVRYGARCQTPLQTNNERIDRYGSVVAGDRLEELGCEKVDHQWFHDLGHSVNEEELRTVASRCLFKTIWYRSTRMHMC